MCALLDVRCQKSEYLDEQHVLTAAAAQRRELWWQYTVAADSLRQPRPVAKINIAIGATQRIRYVVPMGLHVERQPVESCICRTPVDQIWSSSH